MPDKEPKLETLRQHGTLNPRSQSVTDELFLKDRFFDPAISSRSSTRCCAASSATASR